MSLRAKMAHGALWSFIEKGGNQLASFVVFVVIARLVGPEQYGLVSLCYVYIGLATTFFGCISDGIVSLRIKDDLRLCTLFWGFLILGFLFAVFGCLIAYPAALLFHQPQLATLLLWVSIVPVLLGFSSLPSALFAAEMNFRITAIRTLVATILGGIVGIALALRGMGAMALIAQQIAVYVISNIVLWRSCAWRPRLQFSRAALGHAIAPGFKMAGTNFLTYVQDQMPRLFIGIFLSPADVGYYAFANRIAGALKEVIFGPISIVVFPALSLIEDDPAERKKIVSELVMILGLIVMPLIAGAIVTAPVYIPLLFGASWQPALVIVQLCFIAVAVSPFITVLQSVFRARNAMGAFFKIHCALVCVSLAACFAVAHSGILPATLCFVGFSALSLPLYTALLERRLHLDLWRDYARLWPALIAAVVMSLCLRGFAEYSSLGGNGWIKLALLVLLGCVVYGAVIGALFRTEILRLTANIRQLVRRKKTGAVATE